MPEISYDQWTWEQMVQYVWGEGHDGADGLTGTLMSRADVAGPKPWLSFVDVTTVKTATGTPPTITPGQHEVVGYRKTGADPATSGQDIWQVVRARVSFFDGSPSPSTSFDTFYRATNTTLTRLFHDASRIFDPLSFHDAGKVVEAGETYLLDTEASLKALIERIGDVTGLAGTAAQVLVEALGRLLADVQSLIQETNATGNGNRMSDHIYYTSNDLWTFRDKANLAWREFSDHSFQSFNTFNPNELFAIVQQILDSFAVGTLNAVTIDIPNTYGTGEYGGTYDLTGAAGWGALDTELKRSWTEQLQRLDGQMRTLLQTLATALDDTRTAIDTFPSASTTGNNGPGNDESGTTNDGSGPGDGESTTVTGGSGPGLGGGSETTTGGSDVDGSQVGGGSGFDTMSAFATSSSFGSSIDGGVLGGSGDLTALTTTTIGGTTIGGTGLGGIGGTGIGALSGGGSIGGLGGAGGVLGGVSVGLAGLSGLGRTAGGSLGGNGKDQRHDYAGPSVIGGVENDGGLIGALGGGGGKPESMGGIAIGDDLAEMLNGYAAVSGGGQIAAGASLGGVSGQQPGFSPLGGGGSGLGGLGGGGLGGLGGRDAGGESRRRKSVRREEEAGSWGTDPGGTAAVVGRADAPRRKPAEDREVEDLPTMPGRLPGTTVPAVTDEPVRVHGIR